jgi:hypothetical protein
MNKCDVCQRELTGPPALLFSPPLDHAVMKFQLCKDCYYNVWIMLNTLGERAKERPADD